MFRGFYLTLKRNCHDVRKRKCKVLCKPSMAAEVKGKRRSSVMTDLRVLHSACEEISRTSRATQRCLPRLRAGSDLGSALHEIAMVLASFDRCLFYFICDELLAPSSRQNLEEKSSLREAMKLSSSAPSNIRKSLLQGGVASCLHLLTRVASNARKMMEIRTMRKNLRSRTRPSHIALLVVGALLSPALPRRSWRKAANFSILFGILGVIGAEAMRRRRSRSYIATLQEYNKQLHFLLRMWMILMSIVRKARSRRAKSYTDILKLHEGQEGEYTYDYGSSGSSGPPSRGHRARSFVSLVALPHAEDQNMLAASKRPPGSKPVSSRKTAAITSLLSIAPPPAAHAWWYDMDIFSRWGMKHGMNTLYASTRFWLEVFREGWEMVEHARSALPGALRPLLHGLSQ